MTFPECRYRKQDDAGHYCTCPNVVAPRPLAEDNCNACIMVVRPSLIQRVAGYKSARGTWIEAGKPIVDADTQTARRAICEACDQFDRVQDACKVCGCFLHETILGDKLAWATEACPIGKWTALPIAQ
jgi:hypothetical protein